MRAQSFKPMKVILEGAVVECVPFTTGCDERRRKCTDRNRRQYPEDACTARQMG